MSPVRQPCPADVLDSIAWYPDAGLSDEQRGAVEAHAAGCTSCRDEIAMLLGGEPPSLDLPDAEGVLERIWSRIDASELEPGPASLPTSGRAAPPRRTAGGFRGFRSSSLAAAAALVLVAAAGFVVARVLAPAEPVYQTASAETTASAAGGPELDVVFEGEASAASLAAALRAIEGEIVAGPSRLGRYRVRLRPGSDAGAAAQRLLGSEGRVALVAEPVVP